MKQKTGRKLLSFLLTLAMVVGLMPGISLTVHAKANEVFLTNIRACAIEGNSITALNGVATATFPSKPVYHNEMSAWTTDSTEGIKITVTAANPDYKISKCRFITLYDDNIIEDAEAPFEYIIPHNNDGKALREVEIYGQTKPDHTALSDKMIWKLGETFVPSKNTYKTSEVVYPSKPYFYANYLYTLVRGNIEKPEDAPEYFVKNDNGEYYAIETPDSDYIFKDYWKVTDYSDGLLVSEGKSRNDENPTEELTSYSFSVHEKEINKASLGSITNGSIKINSNNSSSVEVEAGEKVTLDVSPDEGYKLKEISAKYLEIQSVSELMEMMGNTKYYVNPNDTEYSDYYMATEDGIKLFRFPDEGKAFLPKTAELDKSKSAEGVYTASGKYNNDTDITWKFTVKKGKIIVISIIMNEEEYPTKIESTGTITEPTYASVELTPVTTGKKYTFTMPATDVTVNAVFEEKHTHNGIDFTAWDNATGLPEEAGNYYLTQDVTLSETWQMPSGTTNLCLNGHNIILKGTGTYISCGSYYDYHSSYILNLYDDNNVGSITCDANESPNLSSIQIAGNGTFTMNGGKITGSKIGAMSIDAGSFVMNGGSITGNSTINNTYGRVKIGGVYCNAGKITMNGGSITGNEGGGVYLASQSYLEMNGGSITGNKGGGVHLQAALLDVQSGAVIIPSATMSLSGDVAIKNNTVSSENTDASNVYLEEGTRIALIGALAENASVGVTMATPGVFTDSKGEAKAKDYADKFTIDDSDYTVAAEGDELTMKKLATPATVSANNRTYDGTEKPLVNVTGEARGGEMQYAIGKDATTAPVDGYKASIPTATNAGTYYVWYKVVGDGNHSDTDPICVTVVISNSGSSSGGSNADAVQAVINKINALDPSASDYAAKAQEAVDAYNALTDSQKTDDRFKDQTVAAKLADAQQAVAEKKAVDEANALICKLPDNPKQAAEADAQAAYKAYMELSEAQKALLSDDAKKKAAVYGYYYEAQYAKAQKAKLTSVKAKKGKKAAAKWKAVSGVSGYQLYYKAKGTKAKKVTIKSAKTLKKTVKKLKAGKKYTFKVRTFTKIYDPTKDKNVRVYGKWSKAKKIRAKK